VVTGALTSIALTLVDPGMSLHVVGWVSSVGATALIYLSTLYLSLDLGKALGFPLLKPPPVAFPI